jgi:hypothetical protein
MRKNLKDADIVHVRFTVDQDQDWWWSNGAEPGIFTGPFASFAKAKQHAMTTLQLSAEVGGVVCPPTEAGARLQ